MLSSFAPPAGFTPVWTIEASHGISAVLETSSHDTNSCVLQPIHNNSTAAHMNCLFFIIIKISIMYNKLSDECATKSSVQWLERLNHCLYNTHGFMNFSPAQENESTLNLLSYTLHPHTIVKCSV